MKILKIFLILLAVALIPKQAFSEHFVVNYTTTGSSATAAVPNTANPNISGDALANGDEIAVFATDGNGGYICVGWAVWNLTQFPNGIAFTVWGDNDQTEIKDGLGANEALKWRVWRQSTNTEYDIVNVAYSGTPPYNSTGLYANGRFFRLTSLQALAIPAIPTPVSPLNNAKGVGLSPTVQWTASNGAEDYEFQASLNSDYSSPFATCTTTTNTTQYVLAGLANYQTVYWRVLAKNNVGSSAWGQYSFRTKVAQATLSAPANGATGLPTNPTLTWNTVTGAANYEVVYSTNQDFNSESVETSAVVAGTTYQPTGLNNFTVYYWRVRALDDAGNPGDWSTTFNFRVIIGSPTPSSPVDNAGGIELDPTLVWNLVNGALNYDIEFSIEPTFTNMIGYYGLTTNSMDVEEMMDLEYFTQYYWRVRATVGEEEGDWAEFTFTTVVGQPTLTAPANNAAGVVVTPNLQWTAANGATLYDVQLASDVNFNNIVFHTEGLTVTNVNVPALLNFHQYYWKVLAYNADGGSWSDTFTFTTIVGVPNLITPANAATNVAAPQSTFTWQVVAGATEYHIQIATDVNFNNLLLDNDDVANVSYQFSDLLFSTTHYWRVHSWNPDGFSGWSNVFSFTTQAMQAPTPGFPANNAVNVVLIPLLNWSDVNFAETYDVQVSTDPNFGTTVINVTGITSSEYQVPRATLLPLTDYYWRTRTHIGTQSSNWSTVYHFTTQDIPVPILDSPANNAVDVQINPTLDWHAPAGYTVDSYDLQVSSSFNFNDPLIDLEGVTNSEYYVGYNVLQYITTYYWRVRLTLDGQTGAWSSARIFTTTEFPPLEAHLANKSVCYYDAVELGNYVESEAGNYYSVTGGSGNYRITWSPSTGLQNATTSNPTLLRATSSKYYTLRVQDLITNEVVTATMYLTVTRPPVISLPRSVTIYQGASYNLGTRLSVGGTSPFTYEWTSADGEIISTDANPSVSPEVTTRYFLTVTDANGCTATPVNILVTVRSPKDGDFDEDLLAMGVYNVEVYPNPTSDELNINANFANSTNLEVTISNTLGQQVLHFNSFGIQEYQKQLDVTSLPSGVYMIQFKFDGNTLIRKFVKQ